jgi:hypothetical protein
MGANTQTEPTSSFGTLGSVGHSVPIKAVLFDLGNTLVGYYTSAEFPTVLRRCLRRCSEVQGWSADAARQEELFERALQLNQERADFAVRPLGERLRKLFDQQGTLDDVALARLSAAFMEPIFDRAQPSPQASVAQNWLDMACLRSSTRSCSASMSDGANRTGRHSTERWPCWTWPRPTHCSSVTIPDGTLPALRTPVCVPCFSGQWRVRRIWKRFRVSKSSCGWSIDHTHEAVLSNTRCARLHAARARHAHGVARQGLIHGLRGLRTHGRSDRHGHHRRGQSQFVLISSLSPERAERARLMA